MSRPTRACELKSEKFDEDCEKYNVTPYTGV